MGEAINLNMLSFLIGSWKTNGTTIQNGTDKQATEISGTDSYEWTLDKKFILHHASVTMGDQNVEVIEMIGVDSERNEFTLQSFDNKGGSLKMSGTLNEQNDFEIKADEMRAGLRSLDANEEMEAHWEKLEKGKWIPWMNLTFKRF